MIQNDEALEEAPRLLMPQATPVSLPATREDIRELGDRKCDITDIQALLRRVASSLEDDQLTRTRCTVSLAHLQAPLADLVPAGMGQQTRVQGRAESRLLPDSRQHDDHADVIADQVIQTG